MNLCISSKVTAISSFIIFVLLLFSSDSLFSQSLICKEGWRIQNTKGNLTNEKLFFFENGVFKYYFKNMFEYWKDEIKEVGTYSISGNELNINSETLNLTCKITWVTENKCILHVPQVQNILARCHSDEDEFYRDHMKCGYCSGTGKCNGCHGKGTIEMLGYSYRCSMCDKTGKCRWCKGTAHKDDPQMLP